MARNKATERILNKALEDGHKVWVIGDVHGHLEVLNRLLDKLELKSEDKVVFVGDLIDRGPDSAGVVQQVRKDKRMFCVMGNHERMMIDAISWSCDYWSYNGGQETMESFDKAYPNESQMRLKDAANWMKQLPTEIVLDKHRIVHAGYDPRRPLEGQSENSLLWIRDVFHLHRGIIDPVRQIVFGHTPTHKILEGIAGQEKTSWETLEDGRPSWIGIDTGISARPEKGVIGALTAYELGSEQIINTEKIEKHF